MSGTRKMPGFELGEAEVGKAKGSSEAANVDPWTFQTKLTRRFVSLADSLSGILGELSVGAGGYAVELTAPEGMSTGGGKQALQHLRLRPRRPGYPVMVLGTVNAVACRAELRDYDHFTAMNEARFRSVVDITRQEWDQLLDAVERALSEVQITATRTPPPRDLAASKPKARTSSGAIIALVVVLVLAALVVLRVAFVLAARN